MKTNIFQEAKKEEIYNKIKDVVYQFNIDKNSDKNIDKNSDIIQYKFQVNKLFDTKKHIKENSDLLEFMSEYKFKSFSFITAQNPFYDKINTTEQFNYELNEKLKLDLNGFIFYESETIFENKIDEKGFVVFDLPIHLLLILKQKYAQNAVVFGNNKSIKLII